MTEQQACTLCGAGGHIAAHCNWNDRRLTFTLESLTEALGNVMCLHELGVELIAANVFRQHPEQAESAQGERDVFESFCTYMLDCTDEANRDFLFNFVQRWETWPDRAALAQPSPAPELDYTHMSRRMLEELAKLGKCLVATADLERLTQERDAAKARVEELETQEPVALANRGHPAFWVKWTDAAAGLYGPGIKLYAAPVAQAGQVPDILTAEDMQWLRRFAECCGDSEAGGHDLPRSAVKQLVHAGALRHCGAGRTETTAFGDWLLATAPAQGGE